MERSGNSHDATIFFIFSTKMRLPTLNEIRSQLKNESTKSIHLGNDVAFKAKLVYENNWLRDPKCYVVLKTKEKGEKKVNIETVKATLCKQPDSATLDRIAQEIRKGLATKPSWWKTLKVPTLMAAALVAAGIVHKFHKNQKSKKRTSTQHAALTRSAAPHDAALAAHDVYVEHVAATSK